LPPRRIYRPIRCATWAASSTARSTTAIKRMAWDALDSSLETALNAERRWQRDAGRTEDFLEGVSAFVEKRKPAFKGR